MDGTPAIAQTAQTRLRPGQFKVSRPSELSRIGAEKRHSSDRFLMTAVCTKRLDRHCTKEKNVLVLRSPPLEPVHERQVFLDFHCPLLYSTDSDGLPAHGWPDARTVPANGLFSGRYGRFTHPAAHPRIVCGVSPGWSMFQRSQSLASR